ncbi:hypothetical protein HSX11_05450 [Oxalobacteraceae bacterium]|nr:hypothetical protein [Oxalobacteraceae bacterium]NRR29625.1 hypothetical protein [Oxalobacteraceae bacterium]
MSNKTRKDEERARIIAQGIFLDSQAGCAVAWAYMRLRGIPNHVMLRVLAGSAQRRVSDVAPPARCEAASGETPRPSLHLVKG